MAMIHAVRTARGESPNFLKKRMRALPQAKAALKRANLPKVYIFNVGNREWKDIEVAGVRYRIPACPLGAKFSEPLAVDSLVPTEYDPANGNDQLAAINEPALTGVMDMGDGVDQQVFGIADDIVGKYSSSPAIGLMTTNREWFGVFVSESSPPKAEDLAQANARWLQMNEMIYQDGADKVSQNVNVDPRDRKVYNDAADMLGKKLLWGNRDHTMGKCPECFESIIDGANYCKNCQQAIDPASVAARAKKRAKANEEAA